MLERLKNAAQTLSFQKAPVSQKRLQRGIYSREEFNVGVKTTPKDIDKLIRSRSVASPKVQQPSASRSGGVMAMEVEAALTQLDKVRREFGLGHPSDEDRIRRIFGPLFNRGLKIDPRVCHSWVLERGWDGDEAAELEWVLLDMAISRT
jgi:hypothetical protein